MQRYCLNCKIFGDDSSFYPDAPEKALCKNCIRERVRNRNKVVFKEAEKRSREQEALRNFVSQIQANKEPFVYLIEHENKYKVGFSCNINKRIKSFNTSHAVPCKLIAIAPGDTSLETKLHNEFEINHVTGEWFLKKPSILNRFKKLDGVMIFLPGYIKQ